VTESALVRQSVAELRSSLRELQRELVALQYRQVAMLAELEPGVSSHSACADWRI